MIADGECMLFVNGGLQVTQSGALVVDLGCGQGKRFVRGSGHQMEFNILHQMYYVAGWVSET